MISVPPFFWRRLLRIATEIVGDPTAEQAHFRSAVNRAYYAAFGEARALAERNGFVPRRGRGSHQQVWDFLANSFPAHHGHQRAAARRIANDGIALKAMRVAADYRSAEVARANAMQAIALAQQIVRRVVPM